MRNHSRQNLRTFHRQSGIPRTLTGEKVASGQLKQSQIRVGKYKYDPKDELGKGFSGKVYKGVEIGRLHKRYAVKVVELHRFKGSSRELFENEIEIHRSLDHDNIVKLHDVVRTKEHYYLVMEYCPHGNLHQYIGQKKQLAEGNALQILYQLIAAYKYLLGQGILHRDIKPANILRVGNKWKLSDFGFAARSRFGFKDRLNVGTPLYMAPETLKRSFYSYKSDLYALAVVLYEMLQGQTPYEARSEKQLMQKIGHEIIVPKSVRHPKIAEFLKKLLLISDAKRMQRDEFQTFDFGQADGQLQHSNTNSVLSYSHRSTTCDDSLLKTNNQSSADLSPKMQRDPSSKQTRGTKQLPTYQSCKSPHNPSNPILENQQTLRVQLQLVHHFYFLIENMESVEVEGSTRSMLRLTLFKLLLKKMRLLCDKGQNWLGLADWEEYKQCKLYQQIYSEFTVQSEKYEQEYLEFIRHNDIKVIRAVNRKFPELCSNNPLNSKFYDSLRLFVGLAIQEHDAALSVSLIQPDARLNDRFEALESMLTIYRLTSLRNQSPKSIQPGEKLNLLSDYRKSKLTRGDYGNLKQLVDNIG